MLKIGKYIARVFHPGQPEFQNRNYTQDSDKTCHKCLTPGHFIYMTVLMIGCVESVMKVGIN